LVRRRSFRTLAYASTESKVVVFVAKIAERGDPTKVKGLVLADLTIR